MGPALTRDYATYPSLSGVYLEDSYVHGIDESPSTLTFALEAVLTPDNPNYHEPRPGEQYCYARGNLVFYDISEIAWLSRSFRKYIDADNEEDLGNIDSLTDQDGVYTAEGDWGKVCVTTDRMPEFNITSTSGR